MRSKTKKIKILCLLIFVGLAIFWVSSGNRFVHKSFASSSGPPPGVSGAPNEPTCTACHFPTSGGGQFSIIAPASYTPGQTYQITVRHQTADASRRRWGFQLTALAGAAPAVNFSNLSGNTQIVDGAAGRKYIEHTLLGSFGGQQG